MANETSTFCSLNKRFLKSKQLLMKQCFSPIAIFQREQHVCVATALDFEDVWHDDAAAVH